MTETQLSDPTSSYYNPTPGAQVTRPPQPAKVQQSQPYNDYYSYMNYLLGQQDPSTPGQTYTGAKAVALAANKYGPNAPASAQQYVKGAGAQYVQPQQQPSQQSAPTASPVSSNGTVQAGPSPTSVPPQPQMQMPTLAQPGPMPTRPSNTEMATPAPLPAAYGGSTFSQFMAPDTSGINGQQQALIQGILANPLTMSPQVVASLEAQQRDQAVQMANQAKAQLLQGAVGRGLTPGASGYVASGTAGIDQNTINSILGSNRDIAIQKATQDRQDQLGALGAADTFLNNQLARATQGYGATLQGQQAQAQDAQAAAAAALQRQQMGFGQGLATAQQNLANYQTDLGAYNQQRSNTLQDFLANLQAYMGQQGLNLDTAKLAETMRQFNDQLGLGYNQLQQNGQQNLLNWLLMNYGG